VQQDAYGGRRLAWRAGWKHLQHTLRSAMQVRSASTSRDICCTNRTTCMQVMSHNGFVTYMSRLVYDECVCAVLHPPPPPLYHQRR
jgi:hypothetical protein